MKLFKECLGEFIGTCILVCIGCGAVAISVIYNTLGLFEVALIFGLGVSIAIVSVRNICPAHLNPAVSVAMVLSKNLALKKVLFYMVSQFLGALFGAMLLFFLFDDAIDNFEQIMGLVRGQENSYRSAMMFGEFFPNPGFEQTYKVSHLKACLVEGIGTFVLVFVIFLVSNMPNKYTKIAPLLIGFTVTLLIILLAPYTQGGFNPARDFSPRIIAYVGGWKVAAFPSIPYSFFTVYMLSPVLGGFFAWYVYKMLRKFKIQP